MKQEICSVAARGGHLEVLQWARSQGCPLDAWTCAHVAREGHVEVLQWLNSQGCLWNEMEQEICSVAARGGHLEVLQWARSQGSAEVGQEPRLSLLGCIHMCRCCSCRPIGGVAMGPQPGLSLG